MRNWARPRWFKDRNDDDLIAYRVRAREGDQAGVPAGCYLVIRVITDTFNVRTLAGPMAEDLVGRLLDDVTPDMLMDVLTALEAQGRKHGKTLH